MFGLEASAAAAATALACASLPHTVKGLQADLVEPWAAPTRTPYGETGTPVLWWCIWLHIVARIGDVFRSLASQNHRGRERTDRCRLCADRIQEEQITDRCHSEAFGPGGAGAGAGQKMGGAGQHCHG